MRMIYIYSTNLHMHECVSYMNIYYRNAHASHMSSIQPPLFGFFSAKLAVSDQWWSWYTRLITQEFLSSFSDSCLSSVMRAKVYFHELVSSCSGFTLDDPPCKNASASIGGLQYRMRKTRHLSTFNISLSQLWQPWYFTSLTWTQ